MSKYITDLSELTDPAADDEFLIRDDSAGEDKRMSYDNLSQSIHDDEQQYVDGPDGLPGIDDELLNFLLQSESTWFSVGPTGAGADATWTALDEIDLSSHSYIEVYIESYGESFGDGNPDRISLYARAHGSSLSITDGTRIVNVIDKKSSGSEIATSNVSTVRKIPVDSNGVFDFYWYSSHTSTTVGTLQLVGAE